ncbi:MAG: glycogen debranching enzyme family protein [Prevotella sp.]|nr:glycogen debranching enzyme family protein [Prevotella sp.]
MSYLKFERALMTNLQESLRKEVLRTSRSGAYSSSTVVDCNTRKYHGLLVVPVPGIDGENHVLLSSLDVSVVQHGAEFNLGLHLYQGGVCSPNGHKYIREFSCDKVPTTIYRVGGVLLRKETIFQTYNDRVMIRYTIEDAHSPVTLRLKPFLAFRRADSMTHENFQAMRDYKKVSGGISTTMYSNYPRLYMQLSKKNEFVFRPDWYKGLEYYKEADRGYESIEDLYVPGYFEVQCKKGDEIVFAASLEETKPSTLKKTFEQEVEVRKPRDNFYNALVAAAHQFHFKKDGERYLLAGYPWFKVRARDTFISLPGLTLAIDEMEYFHTVMQTALKGLYEFMDGKPLTVDIHEIEQPDVVLWAVWAIQQYAKKAGMEQARKEYGKVVADIMRYILSGRHINLTLRENGLLHTEGRDRPMTWMNSMAGGKPVVPRTGYVVEINALWYNALRFCAELAGVAKDTDTMTDMEERAALAKVSFQKVFVTEAGYLLDYVEEGIVDLNVRPNMIFAVALDYSPLDTPQQKSVLDFCTRELLTPKGLRTLSPKSGGYNPMYVGPQTKRDYAYHNGTAWPWLGGFYMEASLKVFKRSRLSFVQRQMVGYEDEMMYHATGTISELFDGNPPFHGRGAMAFAMNVAEVLRSMKIIDQYKE